MPLERIEENFEGPSWSNRIFFYFCLFSSLLIIFLLVFISFTAINPDFAIPNGPHYNTTELRNMGFFDNERYLISALVQSLAATIALVITLSLVAVQLAAQSYSARVIDVYKNNPDMWILLSTYIVVIFYGLGLLKVIDIGVAGINIEFAIFAAYFLGFFAFVCLIPYMLKTLDLLKPSVVIKISSEKITKENVLKALNNYEGIDEIDPVQPITDIINSALEKNDYETVRNGLKAITKSTVSILEKSHFERGEQYKFVRYIIDIIKNIAIFAIKKENDNSTLSVITNLEIIGTKAAENNREIAAKLTAKALREIGTKAAEKEREDETWAVVEALENMGIKAAEQRLQFATGSIAKELENVGMQSLEHELIYAAQKTEEALGKVGIKAAENEHNDETRDIAIAIGNVGTKALEQRHNIALKRIVEASENQRMELLEIRLGGLAIKAVELLENVGVKAAEQKIQDYTGKSHETQRNGGEGAFGERLEIEWQVAEALYKIGTQAVKQKSEGIAIKAAKEIGNAGVRAAGQRLYQTTNKTVEALRDMGIKTASVHELKNITTESENALSILIKKSEEKEWPEIVETIKEALQTIEQAKNNKSNT